MHIVPVPESDTEIIEEVTYLHRTKRGLKTTTKQVTMEQPLKEKRSQASHSRSKSKSQPKIRQDDASSSELASKIGEMEIHETIEGNDNVLHDHVVEDFQPQTRVRHCYSTRTVDLMKCRQPWINGWTIGANT